MSRTLTLPANNFTWTKKKPCSPGATKIFVPLARIELATFHQGSSVSEVGILPTSSSGLFPQKMGGAFLREKPWGRGLEFYYTSRVYYTSVLGAECIALLCSVSRVASASFSFLIFNDVLVHMYVLVSWTLTRIYTIFVPRSSMVSYLPVN